MMEVRRQDGGAIRQTVYLTSWLTFKDICNMPQFAYVAFFSKSSPFTRLRKALKCRMKELTAAGVGVSVKRTDPISPNDELALWNSGVMNMTTSKGLSYTVFLL